MRVLGLNSAGFNTSSALVVDGEPVFAVEEERLNREKRTRRFPTHGIHEALKAANLEIEEIDIVAVSWNPAINLEAFNGSQSQRARYLGEILYSVPNHLMSLKSNNAAALSRQTIEFEDGNKLDIVYVTHHLAHAASFFFSPFEEAAILTVDAFGEKHSVMFCRGRGNKIETLWSQEFPHALGSFYSAMTAYLGFLPQNDEWKLMGASAYGDQDRYYDRVRALVDLKDEGGFELNLTLFKHYQFHRPGFFDEKLIAHLDVPPNPSDDQLTQDHYDLAAAAQRVTEDVYFHLLRHLHRRTGLDCVVLSGGVALNSVANGKVAAETPFENIFVPPVPDDSGGALGAAFYAYNQLADQPRQYVMTSNYLGPGYTDPEIQNELERFGIHYRLLDEPSRRAAELLCEGLIVGWFQGRLEFGDRALGNRSILADPRDPLMKDKINARIKYREAFRPFAPAILCDYLDEYFVDAAPTPFMEKVFQIKPEKREMIPAVTHVDGSGRLQTVSPEQNAEFARLISEFDRLTGIPIVLNTSFNVKGEPIVCTPQDAIRTFFSSGLDALILGKCLITKSQGAPE